MLDLGVELGAQEHQDRRNPQPDHQADDSAERTVGSVIVGKACEIPGEQE